MTGHIRGGGRLVALAVLVVAPVRAQAQDVDIEVPVLILDSGEESQVTDEELDLANIVQTAAKGVTTVQEAPAIVTVITDEDIRESGHTEFIDILGMVPGLLRSDAINHQFPYILSRGTVQAVLYLQNGLSMFDPSYNAPELGRVMPVELIKRIEVITGPGGTLWGAQSYMGIMNVITKDAEDVDGVEASVRTGTGPGDRNMLHGYVLAGDPELGFEGLSGLLHASFLTYKGPNLHMPLLGFATPAPQPNSPNFYGPLMETDQPQSFMFQLNGKLEVGPLSIYGSLPFLERYLPMTFSGGVANQNLPEDDLPECSAVDPFGPGGQPNPDILTPGDMCVDRGQLGRYNRSDWLTRYVMADYRTRFADNKAGLAVKGFFNNFERHWGNLTIFSPTALVEGGLGIEFKSETYRAGSTIDGDYELPGNVRLLYGTEVFREWVGESTDRSRQGAGVQVEFTGPNNLAQLPLPCPREPDPDNPGQDRFVGRCPLTFSFKTDRTVMGAYLNPQWRPTRKLILDGGMRVQAAPAAFSKVPYDTQYIFSGAAVYNFVKDWHFKLNYTEGFRPPVFNNTDSNGASVNLDGRRDLAVETSQAIQGEINARLFRGQRRVRELNFRVDYSYTRLTNLIEIINNGRYENAGERGIHSAEFLGKLYLTGGHHLELAYTWLRVNTADKGRLRAIPEHWFNLSGVFSLIPESLTFTTGLRVLGAMEDPNRIVEYRDYAGQLKRVEPHELVLDRLPPSANLLVALTYLRGESLSVRLAAYNAFNGRNYEPDPFHQYEPIFENQPMPYADARVTLGMTYTY